MTEKKTTKKRRARGAGRLIWRPSGWYARFWTTIDGERVRVCRPLGTKNRPAAEAKLRRLLEAETAPSAAEAMRVETFAEAAERIVNASSVKTKAERLSRLRRYAFGDIGHRPLRETRKADDGREETADSIRPADIRGVLEAAATSGLSLQTVEHLRNDLGSVFGRLFRDEEIRENPMARVALADLEVKPKQDKRPRVQPTDEQFSRFAACAEVPEELYIMALTSRCFGGQRTSDLHAWDWSHVDTATFASAKVYRPKTDGDDEDGTAVLDEIEIPPMLVAPLQAWWRRWGKAKEGPVFPIMRGKRVGERQGKRSHARELRQAFWAAGVHLPLEGFPEAMAALRRAEAAVEPAKAEGMRAWWAAKRERRQAEQRAKALDAIQTDTKRTRALDFHSLRRAYNTALAAAGVNVQQAMALTGHTNTETHMRYVNLVQLGPLAQPAAALPLLSARRVRAPAVPYDLVARELSIRDPNETRTRVTGVRGRCPNR